MLLNKVIKPVLIVFAFFVFLYLLASQLLGPGVGDFSTSIANGYKYEYLGGNERVVVYQGEERSNTIIIDSRVDDYFIENNNLLVARRPREIYKDHGITKSRLSNNCEYWVINIKTHEVKQITDFGGLRCKKN